MKFVVFLFVLLLAGCASGVDGSTSITNEVRAQPSSASFLEPEVDRPTASLGRHGRSSMARQRILK